MTKRIWGLYEEITQQYGSDWPRVDELKTSDGVTMKSVWVPGLMRDAINAIVWSQRDNHRSKAVSDFLNRVTKLSESVNEIKQQAGLE